MGGGEGHRVRPRRLAGMSPSSRPDCITSPRFEPSFQGVKTAFMRAPGAFSGGCSRSGGGQAPHGPRLGSGSGSRKGLEAAGAEGPGGAGMEESGWPNPPGEVFEVDSMSSRLGSAVSLGQFLDLPVPPTATQASVNPQPPQGAPPGDPCDGWNSRQVVSHEEVPSHRHHHLHGHHTDALRRNR